MAELEPNDPRLKAAMVALSKIIANFMYLEMTPRTLQELMDAIKWHRDRCKAKHGFDFPVLVPFVLPRLGTIDMVRADLDRRSIEQLVINKLREHEAARITMEEVVAAVRAAFPDFKPHALYALKPKKELQ